MSNDEFEISHYINEKKLLESLDSKDFIENISEIGFRCDMCARCCTGAQNDHVFLLEDDTDRILKIDENSIYPSPLLDFSDQFGNFYVAGYALKTSENDEKSCIFLNSENRCKIYDKRPLICQVYPYMVFREPDSKGKIDWRYFAGLGDHGCYNLYLSEEELKEIWDITIKYEIDYLNHEINFRKYIKEYFENNNLNFVKRKHAEFVRKYNSKKNKNRDVSEEPIIYVYHRNKFEKYIE
ncbi:MAG: YkgJ family cysteine cluster protein [Methanosarcinaceae archaeon]|nr:YkgJ family cysteine cluster protein [Methanosarcinaceae archaeon]